MQHHLAHHKEDIWLAPALMITLPASSLPLFRPLPQRPKGEPQTLPWTGHPPATGSSQRRSGRSASGNQPSARGRKAARQRHRMASVTPVSLTSSSKCSSACQSVMRV